MYVHGLKKSLETNKNAVIQVQLQLREMDTKEASEALENIYFLQGIIGEDVNEADAPLDEYRSRFLNGTPNEIRFDEEMKTRLAAMGRAKNGPEIRAFTNQLVCDGLELCLSKHTNDKFDFFQFISELPVIFKPIGREILTIQTHSCRVPIRMRLEAIGHFLAVMFEYGRLKSCNQLRSFSGIVNSVISNLIEPWQALLEYSDQNAEILLGIFCFVLQSLRLVPGLRVPSTYEGEVLPRMLAVFRTIPCFITAENADFETGVSFFRIH